MSAAHHVRRPVRIAGSWLGIGVVVCALIGARSAELASIGWGPDVRLLENEGFESPPSTAAPGRISSWRTVAGRPHVERTVHETKYGPKENAVLVLPPGAAVEQPIAIPPELLSSLRLHYMGVGGAVVISDGSGREVRVPPKAPRETRLGNPSHIDVGQVLKLSEIPGWTEQSLTPRLVVRLEVAEGAREARVSFLMASVEFPEFTEQELRTELLSELDWVFSRWLELGLDRVGPRETAFLSTAFDAMTGEPLVYLDGGAHPFYALLGRALQVEDNARWGAAYDAYLTDLFALAYHPDTGLPRVWNVQTDQPDDETPREVAYSFGHLLDIAEEGPERWRAQALAQAVRIGEMVLAKGVLPDGEVAARYRPRDGEPNTSYPPLRRLDVPCELARLGALTGDDRYTAAARDAFAQFEFTHSWPGTWDAIDPGFDDNYGHYGARAVKAWEAHPDEPAFRNVAEGGARHYMPIWRDALQLGGNIAADQVRCWKILRDVAALEPSLKSEVRELLYLAARNHFKGQQYADGTWGDVTIYDFDPKAYLEVGDLPGIARNLVEGLAFVYEDDLDLATDEQRALFTTVFRSSRDHYKREFGYLSTRTERTGANPAGGGVRLAAGMVEMLHQLGVEAR